MTDATSVLVKDLEAVAAHVPLIITGLRTHTLSSVKQHTFGALLIELGENVHQHADTHTPPDPRPVLETRSAPTADAAAQDCEWSVSAIAARVERERGTSTQQWPANDPDTPPEPAPHSDHHRPAPDEAHDQPDLGHPSPQPTAATGQRPYPQPSPRPRQPPPPPAAPDLTPTPRLGLPTVTPTDLTLLQRIRDGLKHL
jgi:hypothetical protein